METNMSKREVIRLDLPASHASLGPLEACIGAVLERVEGLTESETADIVQTVRRAFVRSLACAPGDGDDEGREVVLTLSLHPHRLTVELDDSWDCSFDLPDVLTSRSEEPRRAGPGLGMGLFLTRQLMDEATYQPQAGNNCWRLVKHLPLSGQDAPGTAPSYTIRLNLPATYKYLNVLGACITGMLAQVEELPEREQLEYDLQLAAQETAANIVNHAYAGEGGRIKVALTLAPSPCRFVIEMHDTGQHTFDLSSVPDPFGAPQLPTGGLLSGSGLFFVSATVVNAGNYLFNLILGRWIGPAAFADLSLIVTLFLAVSFLAAGFQQTAARFSAAYAASGDADASIRSRLAGLRRWLARWAWALGGGLLALLALGAPLWKHFFHTQSAWPFVILGIGVPFYLAQGVDRGILQGQTRFGTLALSYQAEMWMRLIVALAFVALGWSVNGAVGGLTASFAATWLVARRAGTGLPRSDGFLPAEQRTVAMFAGSVAIAEMGQILINNSDVLVVKHFFAPEAAGLYAALAIVGRIVFFATRSVVTAMFPIVAQKQQKGEPHRHLLGLSLGMVAAVAAVIVAAMLVAPDFIVRVLFGEAYLSIAPLLWLYAVATALYALANVVINYRLSLGHGRGSLFSLVAGVAQVGGLWFFHASLRQVVVVQIVIMAALLVVLVGWNAPLRFPFMSNVRSKET